MVVFPHASAWGGSTVRVRPRWLGLSASSEIHARVAELAVVAWRGRPQLYFVGDGARQSADALPGERRSLARIGSRSVASMGLAARGPVDV